MSIVVVGRIFAGLGVGLVSCLIPMYQSEWYAPFSTHHRIMLMISLHLSSPKWVRGAVVSLYQWAITIGLLLASVINNATKDREDHSSYRITIAIQFIWAAVLASGMTFLPEASVPYVSINITAYIFGENSLHVGLSNGDVMRMLRQRLVA